MFKTSGLLTESEDFFRGEEGALRYSFFVKFFIRKQISIEAL